MPHTPEQLLQILLAQDRSQTDNERDILNDPNGDVPLIFTDEIWIPEIGRMVEGDLYCEVTDYRDKAAANQPRIGESLEPTKQTPPEYCSL